MERPLTAWGGGGKAKADASDKNASFFYIFSHIRIINLNGKALLCGLAS